MPHVPDLDDLIDAAVAQVPRGRKGATALPPTLVREIAAEDLPRLASARRAGIPAMQRVRTTHHLAAREVARGKSDTETSLVVGYTPMRISQLRADPAFQELVAHYQQEDEVKWLFVQERLQALGLALTEELMERLENNPEKFSNEELRRWTETVLDRAGHGKQVTVNSRSLSVHVIEQIKREAAEQTTVQMIGREG